MVVCKNTILFNSDKELVQDIRKALQENGGYCPCSLVKDDDTKCICREFREQIDRGEAGYCHCGLYQYIGD